VNLLKQLTGARVTAEDELPVTVIEPPRRWGFVDFRALWAYRELFASLAARDLKVRYKQTELGAAWAIIQPL
jgi:lipopolysaccharide transport system permease protein